VERELTDPVRLCTPDGHFDQRAAGWSRRPLHTCNLRGRWPRKKRWDFWAVTTERHVLFVCVADVDYLGLALVSVLDLASGERFEAAAVTPFGLGVAQPQTVGGGPVRFDRLGVHVAIDARPDGTAIRASGRSLRGDRLEVDLVVRSPPGQETLTVALPLAGDAFQLTSKHVGLPASGRVTLRGVRLDFERAAACLDFGRGVWPRRTSWCWAAGSGTTADGRAVAVNLGGLWTDGAGVTENGVWVDGRLHKVGARAAFVPEPSGWRIGSDPPGAVDLRLERVQRRRVRFDVGVLGARLDWSAGRFVGSVTGEDGERVTMDGALGWAERFDARW